MARLEGKVSLTNLPPHRGVVINFCLYEVSDADAPPPYTPAPPNETATDCHEVIEDVHFEQESRRSTVEHAISIEHEPGYYYAQVRVILFLERAGSILAQVEQFFFDRRPVQIGGEQKDRIIFPVSWPTTAIERLHRYGTIKPQGEE